MGTLFKLDPDVEQRLDALKALTGQNTQDQVREAILRGLEDMENLASADAVMARVRSGEERIFSSAEIRKELGLDD